MVISMLKIRRPLWRLIFNMGIAIPGKTVFLIETSPWSFMGFNDLEYIYDSKKLFFFKMAIEGLVALNALIC